MSVLDKAWYKVALYTHSGVLTWVLRHVFCKLATEKIANNCLPLPRALLQLYFWINFPWGKKSLNCCLEEKTTHRHAANGRRSLRTHLLREREKHAASSGGSHSATLAGATKAYCLVSLREGFLHQDQTVPGRAPRR